jgi:serine/threonine-protein kinase
VLRVGEQYQDRYEVLEEVGEGGFAYVFRARELQNGRPCALKVLKDPYLSVNEVVERFQREVFAVASIASPHVVKLHDFAISGSDFCIVMEYVEGPTLREMVRPQWAANDLRVVIGHIAHALDAAHRQGIVHRDLKPENVVLVRDDADRWRAKVLDFGLAKLPELERTLGLEQLTRQGFCFGTPHYMAPEQMQGDPVDARADVYALGVIAYELIAGHPPFNGADPRAVMTSVLSDELPLIQELHPSLQARVGQLNDFFARALAKRPRKRPSTVQAFFRELCEAIGADDTLSGHDRSDVSEVSLEGCSAAPLHLDAALPDDATIVDATTVARRFSPSRTSLTLLSQPPVLPLPEDHPSQEPAEQRLRSELHAIPDLRSSPRRWGAMAAGLCFALALAAFLLGCTS